MIRKPRSGRTHVAQRALAMLAALQERDASREELVAIVQSEVGEGAYGASPADSFDNDKRFLQDLDFIIEYVKREKVYRLKREAHPLLRLALTDGELEVLPLVQQAFVETPYTDAVTQLVNCIRTYLSPAQRERETMPLFALVMANMDTLAPHIKTIRLLQQAIKSRHWVEFDYHSPRTGKTTHHVVPVHNNLECRDGHVYFEAFYQEWKTLDYRVDRIVPNTVKLLPNKFPEGQRQPLVLPLRYRLAAEISRYGATRHFDGHQEERQPDGSLVVTARLPKDDLFWASKKLLKYGENCVVLEPPELIEMMKKSVREMARNYGLVVT